MWGWVGRWVGERGVKVRRAWSGGLAPQFMSSPPPFLLLLSHLTRSVPPALALVWAARAGGGRQVGEAQAVALCDGCSAHHHARGARRGGGQTGAPVGGHGRELWRRWE